MDMGLLKPLSEILGVGIIDILNGEIVSDNKLKEKSEETLESLAKFLNVKARSFSVYHEYYDVNGIFFLVLLL